MATKAPENISRLDITEIWNAIGSCVDESTNIWGAPRSKDVCPDCLDRLSAVLTRAQVNLCEDATRHQDCVRLLKKMEDDGLEFEEALDRISQILFSLN